MRETHYNYPSSNEVLVILLYSDEECNVLFQKIFIPISRMVIGNSKEEEVGPRTGGTGELLPLYVG